MRTLLVASQKGGVGKTTTAVNIAALAAEAGARVLLIDADPLGSVATSLQLARRPTDGSPAPRPDGVTRRGCVWADVLPRVDVVCPYPDGDTAEEHLKEFVAQLPSSPVPRFYDRVIIDAPPPMLGPRPKALLKAAEEVLIVQRAEPMSFRTLPAYLELIQEVRNEGGTVRLRGLLLTLPAGVPAGGKMEQRLREKFRGLLPVTIPHDPAVNSALVLGRPVSISVPDSAVAKRYRDLAAHLGLAGTSKPRPVEVAAGIAVGKPEKTKAVGTSRAAATAAVGVMDMEPVAVGTLTPPPAKRTKPLMPASVPTLNPLALPQEVREMPAAGGNPNGLLFAVVGTLAALAAAAGTYLYMNR